MGLARCDGGEPACLIAIPSARSIGRAATTLGAVAFPVGLRIVVFGLGATAEHLGQPGAQFRWHQAEGQPDEDAPQRDDHDRQDPPEPTRDRAGGLLHRGS